jgi:uncharacterized surface protein with fasciclin (FAS1) repeats
MKTLLFYSMASLVMMFVGFPSQAQDQKDSKNADTSIIPDYNNFDGNVFELIRVNPEYSVFSQLIQVSDVQSGLQETGPYTIFAPTNEAFSKLPAGQVDSLVAHADQAASFIKAHMVTGNYGKEEITISLNSGAMYLTNINNEDIHLSADENKNLVITNKKGIKAIINTFDMKAKNGFVHGINHVLFP